jgi:hypothetical protein
MFQSLRWCILLLLLIYAIPASAQVYDAADDFSAVNNPNGVWMYGYSNTLGGSFNLYTNTATFGQDGLIDAWNRPNSGFPDYYPIVYHNGTANPVAISGGAIGPGEAGLHPGPDGQYSIFRWTAPFASEYALVTAFTGIENSGNASSDVHVLHNNVSLFDGVTNGLGSLAYYQTRLTLAAGDTLDFAVGYGSNGNFVSDTTGLKAHIAAVPAPSALVTALIGTVPGIPLLLRRRRKQ